MSEKKCPHCGKWSKWNNSLQDACDHCGQPLAKTEIEREEKRAREREKNEKDWMFYIHPEDNGIVRFFKKTGNLFYTVFMAIMTFIMWLIAALPG